MRSPIKHGVKYGSVTHYILNYAKMKSRIKDGTFSVDEYHAFRQKIDRPSSLRRSVETLVKYGHLQKVSANRFKFTETGLRCIYDLQEVGAALVTEDLRDRMIALHGKNFNMGD